MTATAPTRTWARAPASVAAFDEGPGRAGRIGLLVLATDQVSEGAMRAMLPDDSVEVYASRVANANPTTFVNLRRMAPALTAATELLLPDDRIDVIAYACTSGAIAIGYEDVCARVWAARPRLPVVTPGSAVIDGLRALGVGSVSLVLPYVEEVSALVGGTVEAAGIRVVEALSFGLLSDVDMARLSPTALAEAAVEADHPDAEAVCILCTAVRAVPVIAELEARIRKPVVTSHQAMLWSSLRAIGRAGGATGFGRLMAL